VRERYQKRMVSFRKGQGWELRMREDRGGKNAMTHEENVISREKNWWAANVSKKKN